MVELAGIGPGPLAAMLLADMGADVVRVDRPPGHPESLPHLVANVAGRNRRSIAVDLKHPDGLAVVLRIVAASDVLIEGFRPGVTERLGLGPEPCLDRNPGLVYGRVTGWGQVGPLADRAGHDINYISMTGALHAIGRHGEAPVVPLNLLGDYGGGAAYLVIGVLAALVRRNTSGEGGVVDAAMVDGVLSLMTPIHQLAAAGQWLDERESNLLDGAAPFYRTYETSDGRYVAVGALEPQFYAQLLAGLGLGDEELPEQFDRSGWPALRARFSDVFSTQSRDEWESHFSGVDACVTPVLSLSEAVQHPHNVERRLFVDVGGSPEPGPAPRFEPEEAREYPPRVSPGANTDEVLSEVGYTTDQILDLRRSEAVAGR